MVGLVRAQWHRIDTMTKAIKAMKQNATCADTLRRHLKDQRGSIFVEYVVIVAVIGLVAASALVRAGGEIVNPYEFTRDALIQPYP